MQFTDTASAGNGGVATASANGGAVAIGDVNSGGNAGNAIGVGDTVGTVGVDGGLVSNSTDLGVSVNGGTFSQLQGKELSYNNLVDVDAAMELIKEFLTLTFAIIKHTNVCGIASRTNVHDAWMAALAGDPESAFGGVLVTNVEVDAATANAINEIFFEVLLAPSFSPEAMAILTTKKNRILLQTKEQQGDENKMFKSLLHHFQKVLQNLIAYYGTFFSVKLYAIEVFVLHRGRIVNTIMTAGNGIGTVFGIIAMHIVNKTALGNVSEKRRLQIVNIIPAYLRHFQVKSFFKSFYFHGYNIQAGCIALFRMRTQQLHAHTNAQNRLL